MFLLERDSACPGPHGGGGGLYEIGTGQADFWRDSVGGREDPKCRVTCGRGLIWIRERGGAEVNRRSGGPR